MAIDRFVWTDHALAPLAQRRLTRAEVERALPCRHDHRIPNRGAADWRVHGQRSDGRRFAVIQDLAVGRDRGALRIVSVWPVR